MRGRFTVYRLVIADDEENIRNGMAHSLPWQELGFEVVALCENGQEVLDRLDECHPDVVLSDIRMPILDGVGLMKRLNRDYPDIKIVILSGYSDFEYLNESIKNHVAEYLLKPTDIDEFEDTFRRLKDTLDHERLRSVEISESVQRHFQVWLQAMMRGTATSRDTERFQPMLTDKGIDMDNVIVVLFTLGGHGGDETGDRAALWRRILEVSETAPANELHRLLFIDETSVMVALFSSEDEISYAKVEAAVLAVQHAVNDTLHETLSAGISNLCTEPNMLPQGYEQANCCAHQSLFMGQGSVVQFRQLGSEHSKNLPYFNCEVIEKAILASDYEAVRLEMDRVFSGYDSPMLNYGYLDQLCLSLLFHISLWGLRYGVLMEDVMHTLGTTFTDIYGCDTLESKRNFMQDILSGFQKELGSRREQGHIANSVAMRVRDYVDHEFCSNTISLESVAASVHKTPAYISRLFKNELGCNFSDYLTDKRMKLAAELLNDPDAHVYSVAEQCGYVDTSNFIRVFKRSYGISPAEYRTLGGGKV